MLRCNVAVRSILALIVDYNNNSIYHIISKKLFSLFPHRVGRKLHIATMQRNTRNALLCTKKAQQLFIAALIIEGKIYSLRRQVKVDQ